MRVARLEAASCHNQLELAQCELGALRQQVAGLAAAQQRTCPPPAADSQHEALQAARLEAADSRYQLRLTELELAKQLDALQELQWQLECVVAQLGLQPVAGTAAPGSQAAAGAAATAPSSAAPAAIDHELLLAKVEELRCAQLQLGEYKRRLAAAEAQLAAAPLQQHEALAPPRQPGVAVPAHAADAAGGGSQQPLDEMVGTLVGENAQLRRELVAAEVRCVRHASSAAPALVTCLHISRALSW